MHASLLTHARLGARVIRADGSTRNLGIVAAYPSPGTLRRLYRLALPYLPVGLTLAAFAAAVLSGNADLLGPVAFGLVTTGGSAYLAADFVAGSSSHVNAFQYHDCGTGTAAESSADTGLQTPAGTARVAASGSNPEPGVFASVALVSFTAPAAVTEWGLFNAPTGGTMWDRRVFAPINVHNRDSIQFTYELTVPAGGS